MSTLSRIEIPHIFRSFCFSRSRHLMGISISLLTVRALPLLHELIVIDALRFIKVRTVRHTWMTVESVSVERINDVVISTLQYFVYCSKVSFSARAFALPTRYSKADSKLASRQISKQCIFRRMFHPRWQKLQQML